MFEHIKDIIARKYAKANEEIANKAFETMRSKEEIEEFDAMLEAKDEKFNQ